ncbi:MAG TPA: tRNA uridine(34) 5-carboxymethylaminomethyl modification radical SAM/GNAT enzyme Elp3, partial [Nitrososphaera sp.]
MLAAAADSDPNYQQACRAIATRVEKQSLSAGEVRQIVREVASSFHLSTMPKNEHIIGYLPKDSRYRKTLMVKPAKTASGVAVIAVMPKPYECPHGKCIYCPGGIEFNTPLSYTGTEPSTKAAQKFQFDPYEQVSSKMKQLQSRGHDT